MARPLDDVTVVEFAGVGPAPFGAMLLADYGADVVRIDRVEHTSDFDRMRGLSRGRRSVAIDLTATDGRDLALELVRQADVVIDPYRPQVMERLGLGPDVCRRLAPQLIYARMTGWGQSGPLAARAGHDLNYLAMAGALHPIGRVDRPPPPPLNLVADFGGGGTYLALGVLAALLERHRSGTGQVLDVAMVDGVASLMTMFHSFIAQGLWTTERESNLLDGGAPFYDTYPTADGRFVAVAALEPKFFHNLLTVLGLEPADWEQYDRGQWPELRHALRELFLGRTRDEWDEIFADIDACVSPVLTITEAPSHPAALERRSYDHASGYSQPAPAPRFGRTPASAGTPPPERGADTDDVLRDLGIGTERILRLRERRIVG